MQDQCKQTQVDQQRDTLSALALNAARRHRRRHAAHEAALAAEREFVAEAWASCQRGDTTWADLLAAYEMTRGWAIPGWTTRWLETVPHDAHAIRRIIAGRTLVPGQRQAPAEYGHGDWSVDRDAPDPSYPPRGTYVVYRLHCAGELLYVGTTVDLCSRLKGHRDKPWDRVTAREAADKVCAEGLEAVDILTLQPPLNAQVGAWGGARALAAAARRAGVLTPRLLAIADRHTAEVAAALDDAVNEDLEALFAGEVTR